MNRAYWLNMYTYIIRKEYLRLIALLENVYLSQAQSINFPPKYWRFNQLFSSGNLLNFKGFIQLLYFRSIGNHLTNSIIK